MSTTITVDRLPSSFRPGDLVFDERAFKKSTAQLLLDYEIASSWWAPLVGNSWLQDRVASYFAWKVRRKYRRYRVFAAIAQVVEPKDAKR